VRLNRIQRIKETKVWFFEVINKIDKLLVKLTKGERGPKLIKLEMRKGISQKTPMKLK
jgi:hypothetical protein